MGGCGFEPAADFDLLRNSTAQDVPCMCLCDGLTGKTKWVYIRGKSYLLVFIFMPQINFSCGF